MLTNEKITPGHHANLDPQNVAVLAAEFGIAPTAKWEAVPSFTSVLFRTVHGASESGPDGQGYILKVSPVDIEQPAEPRNRIEARRLRLSHAFAGLLRPVLQAMEPPVAVVGYEPVITRSNQGDIMTFYGEYGNPAVVMKEMPGTPASSKAPEGQVPSIEQPKYLAQLARVQAATHAMRTEPSLLALANELGDQELTCVEDYTGKFLRPLPEDVVVPRRWQEITQKANEYWPLLESGVGFVDLWHSNTMVEARTDEAGETHDVLTGIFDINDTQKAPRLWDTAVTVWGLFVCSGGKFEIVTEYMAAYSEELERLEVPLTDIEKEALWYMVAARAFTAWQGAKIANPLSAANDEEHIAQLLAHTVLA